MSKEIDEHNECRNVLNPSPLHHLPKSSIVSDSLDGVIKVNLDFKRITKARCASLPHDVLVVQSQTHVSLGVFGKDLTHVKSLGKDAGLVEKTTSKPLVQAFMGQRLFLNKTKVSIDAHSACW